MVIVCSCSSSLMTSDWFKISKTVVSLFRSGFHDNINLQYHPVLSCRPAHLISVGYPILIPNGPPNLSL